ncbi:ABC transporter substrate-binding protein [Halosimplex halophilum]|uniref:ABC transporter substrate-binding protein n=1 Tax=Halosimplex halophilum TaxID=2559572 RepID=UPI00107FC2D6|nr:ABC transporter substrate-binding protein [Halosimplex halophilum]
MEPHDRNAYSRRRVVKGIGLTGVTLGLAGCSGDTDGGGGDGTDGAGDGGDGGDGGTSSENTPSPEPVESTWKGVLTKPGEDGQHNPWGKNYNFDGFFLYDHLGRYHGNNHEFVGFVADDWSVDGTTATLQLRDTYTWHDGDPVTADDLVTQLDIESLLGSPFDTVESYEKTGERSMEFSLSKPANEFMVLNQILSRRLQAKTSIYGEFAERARNAESEEEEQAVITDLQEMELQFGAEKHPIGNGPWQFKSASNQEWTFELYEDYDNGHFSADERNFSQAGWRYVPSKSKRSLALANDRIDYWTKTHPTQSQIEQQPDAVDWNKVPLYNGYGLVANFNKEPWDDRRVRQAMLYAIDFGLVAENTSGAYQRDAIEIPCGVSNSMLDTYLGDAQDQYLTYEKDREKAAQLLRDAGFSKSDGTWQKPDGEPFAPTIKEGRGGYWVSIGQNVTSQLGNFGVDAELQKVGHTQMYGEIVPNGNFDVIGDWWSGVWFQAGYPGYHIRAVTLGWWADQTNYPEQIDVPMPVGDPNGSTETVDVAQLFEDLSTAQDPAEEQRLNRKAAWLYNMTLPKMPITVEHDINLFDTKNWELPPLDGELMQQGEPHWWADRMGEIQARTK